MDWKHPIRMISYGYGLIFYLSICYFCLTDNCFKVYFSKINIFNSCKVFNCIGFLFMWFDRLVQCTGMKELEHEFWVCDSHQLGLWLAVNKSFNHHRGYISARRALSSEPYTYGGSIISLRFRGLRLASICCKLPVAWLGCFWPGLDDCVTAAGIFLGLANSHGSRLFHSRAAESLTKNVTSQKEDFGSDWTVWLCRRGTAALHFLSQAVGSSVNPWNRRETRAYV